MVSIYHQIILTHLEPDVENHYFLLRNLLKQHGADLPKAEMSQVYQAALNYCNRQINNGKFYFLDESFALYKQFLQRELIFENGYITHWTFKNVVVLALRLKEFDWAKRFIHKYGQYIHETHRENAITYNLAQLYFYQQKYTGVLTQLQAVQYKDVTYNLGSKAMLFATYYELGEWEALHSLAASFRLYLNRKKQTISEKRRSSYINFINFTMKLSKIMAGDYDAIEKLRSSIDKTPTIASESWLKEKLLQKKEDATTSMTNDQIFNNLSTMAYDESLSNRIADKLEQLQVINEPKGMFGGISYMVQDKMCIGVSKNRLMVRIDPEIMAEAIKRKGAAPVAMGGRKMKGFIYVQPEGYDLEEDFDHWVSLALDYNPRAKSSKKKSGRKA